MPTPCFEVEFTGQGVVFKEAAVSQLLEGLAPLTDLLVLSHGWNNNMEEARDLYQALLAHVETLLVHPNLAPGLQARRLGVLCLFWPSKRFDEADLIPAGGAAALAASDRAGLLRLLDALKRDPQRLGDASQNAARIAHLERAIALVPRLEADPSARSAFVEALRAIFDRSGAHADDASSEFFSLSADQLFQRFETAIQATGPQLAGGALRLGGSGALGAMEGGAAAVSDALSGVTAAARRMTNYATYFDMKQRAGMVGKKGVAPLLLKIRAEKPDLRLHLVGHSFGGRLLTAAAQALPPHTPQVSLTLLQAAYSHNGLAKRFGQEGRSGAFRSLIADQRISGPILITHTKNDTAVGIAYALASRMARDVTAALGDQADPYGGMGRNGAQHTDEAVPGTLLAVGSPYRFAPGKVYNLLADAFIANHSDVTGPEVAYALLHAVLST